MWHDCMWLITFLAPVFSFSRLETLKQGDNCDLRSGGKGICIKILDCPTAIHDVNVNNKWPLFCNRNYSEQIICCENLDAFKSTTNTRTKAHSNRAGRIATKKCREYSRWLDAPENSGEKFQGVCGIPNEKFVPAGRNSNPIQFPHMVYLSLGNETPYSHNCAAVVISDEYLLTSAHCLRTSSGSPVTVAQFYTDDSKSLLIVKIKELIAHPDWASSKPYNDLALVRLERPLEKFTDFIRPACIQIEKEIKETQGIESAYEWTRSSKGNGSLNIVREKMAIVNHTRCSEVFKKFKLLDRGVDDKSMICAGGDFNKDTCYVNSGGPLQIVKDEPKCMYSIVGIVSFGRKCGVSPGVYTKVSNYVEWIESIVWPAEKI